MKRLVQVGAGSAALALGVALGPIAVTASTAAHAAASAVRSADQLHPQYGKLPVPRVVNLRAVSRAAQALNPDLASPSQDFNRGAATEQRAAVAGASDRLSGVAVAGGSRNAAAAVSSGQTWSDFPAMSRNLQVSLLGPGQNREPPDTQVAAGPNSVVEAATSSLSVWSKTGNLLAAVDLDTFFHVPTVQGLTQIFTDPRVLYDTQSGRWFLSGRAFLLSPVMNEAYLAVSATSDPTGNWYIHVLYSDGTASSLQPEQPMTGICDDKVVVSWNAMANYYAGAQTVVLQKSSLLAGSTSVTTASFLLNPQFRLVPAQSLSPTSTCWMAINNADSHLDGSSTSPTLGVYAITGTPDAGNVTLTDTELPLINPTSAPPLPQQPSGTSNDGLTDMDDHLLSAVWQDNRLWTSATVACQPTLNAPSQDCMRLWEVDTSAGTPSLLHDFELYTSGVDEYYPAVSLDSAGDLFVSYTASSPTLFPGAYAVISPASSPGTFSAPVTIAAGAASYAHGASLYNGGPTPLWGAYSAAAPDPSVPGAVWVAAEYAPSDAGSGDWGTAAALVSLTAPPSPARAIGAEGGDGQLWANMGSGWKPLGGKIIAPPAVVAAAAAYSSTPAQPLFIATGTDKHLYIRSLSLGWQLLGPSTASCLGGPAAVITGGTLTVACEGTNRGLWVNSAPVTTATLPHFYSGWKPLGGVLSAGPAVAPVRGTMTFFVRGTNGRIYIRTLTAPYSATPWLCIGAPAAAAETASSDTIFACQGGNHALYEAVSGGAGWTGAVSLGGSLIGGPGVAATSRVTELLAEGSNHAVWLRTPSGWSSLGGVVVGGVGAAALN